MEFVFALNILGWVFDIFGWVLKFSYDKYPMDIKVNLAIFCFIVALIMFIASIIICLTMLI